MSGLFQLPPHALLERHAVFFLSIGRCCWPWVVGGGQTDVVVVVVEMRRWLGGRGCFSRGVLYPFVAGAEEVAEHGDVVLLLSIKWFL